MVQHCRDTVTLNAGPSAFTSRFLPLDGSFSPFSLQPRIFRGWSTNQFEQVLGLQMSNSSQKMDDPWRNPLPTTSHQFHSRNDQCYKQWHRSSYAQSVFP